MKLIKCNHCGRPFYDSDKTCPYCGHAATLSAANIVTRPISDPKSHKLMEDMLSGNYVPPTLRHAEPENTTPDMEAPEAMTQQPAAEPEIEDMADGEVEVDVEDVADASAESEEPTPSDTVLERADTIAAVTTSPDTDDADASADDVEPNQIETTHPPRHRRGWIWIVIILVVLAIAAVAFLKWDFISAKFFSPSH